MVYWSNHFICGGLSLVRCELQQYLCAGWR